VAHLKVDKELCQLHFSHGVSEHFCIEDAVSQPYSASTVLH